MKHQAADAFGRLGASRHSRLRTLLTLSTISPARSCLYPNIML